MLPTGLSYEDAQRQFRWPVPARFNMARALVDRHQPASLALIVEDAGGSVRNWTFGDIDRASARLANALAGLGVKPGDRIAVLLSQSAELVLCHIAGYRMGALVLPLFTLFGEEAIEFRARDAGASVLITDLSQLAKVDAVRERLPALREVIVIGAGRDGGNFRDWDITCAAASDRFTTVYFFYD